MDSQIEISGINGDRGVSPPASTESLWAALGGGADGLHLLVTQTQDNVVVCVPKLDIELSDGETRAVSRTPWKTLQDVDAGAGWNTERGQGEPWSAKGNKRPTRFARLIDVLQIFGRRCALSIQLLPTPHYEACTDLVASLLRQFGLQHRIPFAVCLAQHEHLSAMGYDGAMILNLAVYQELPPNLNQHLHEHPYKAILVREDQISALPPRTDTTPPLWVDSVSPESATHFTQAFPDHIQRLLCAEALAVREVVRPPFPIFHDDFSGTDIDRSQWTAGYSHVNSDTRVFQDDGAHIAIQGGGEYSGAAFVTTLPIHGDFDARVEYEVASPHQGTTFELAAIGIDPGYFNIDNSNLNGRKVNLTFDVHGAPPYASSECDEDDGHRIGWNNGYNLTKVGDITQTADGLNIDPWAASSVNMYNKYGRDVGAGARPGSRGVLRLVRHGSVFSAYFQDADNPQWVCSGSALVHNLKDDVFLRLAAKHWKKSNPEPPPNHVTFRHFTLYQF